jgi:hypothetical protein
MPKEVIYDEATMYDAVVGWAPDEYVQVGVQTHGGDPIVKVLGAGEEPRAFTEMAEFTGLWGTFDRVGVNRLIRALRRARDQAYGKDE